MHKWKLIMTLTFIFFVQLGYSQTQSVFRLHSKTKNNQALHIEWEAVSKKALDSLSIDIKKADTVFLIRGIDIQSGTVYGYVWGSFSAFKYIDPKELQSADFLNSVPALFIIKETEDWEEFFALLPFIGKWDDKGLQEYVSKCDDVIGGIYFWNIFKIVNQGGKSTIEMTTIKDFGRCN